MRSVASVCMCVCVCVSVCLSCSCIRSNFWKLWHEHFIFATHVYYYIFRISRSYSYIKVIGSKLRSQEPKIRTGPYTRVIKYAYTHSQVFRVRLNGNLVHSVISPDLFNLLNSCDCRVVTLDNWVRVIHRIILQQFYASCAMNRLIINPFKPSGAKWLHYKVFKAILV